MDILPFSIAPDAAELIVELYEIADQDNSGEALVPVLVVCRRSQLRGSDGRILEQYLNAHFDLGWDSRKNEAFSDYPSAEILGRTLLIEPLALEMLQGKELVADLVEVGYPNPGDRSRRILRCK
jgi:hypothetical protein